MTRDGGLKPKGVESILRNLHHLIPEPSVPWVVSSCTGS